MPMEQRESEVSCERVGTNTMNVEAPTTTIVETERYWYYLEDDKQRGPFPENLIGKMLRERVLRPDTLIWSEPMTDWILASEVDVFKTDFCCFPPPVPQVTAPSRPADRPAADAVPQVRPWVRFWARLSDIYFFAFLCGVALGIVYPPALDLPDGVMGALMLLIWVFVEAWLLSTWGTTPGKWPLKTTVRNSAGRKLTFSEALSRSFLVWVKGLGFGLPIVNLITLAAAHARLKREGSTSWDYKIASTVIHDRISEFRTVVTVFLLLGFLALIVMGSL